MDKCTFCAGRPEKDRSGAEFEKYCRSRTSEGKLPLCAEMCATEARLAGDGDVVADIFQERTMKRSPRPDTWGWDVAYKDGTHDI